MTNLNTSVIQRPKDLVLAVLPDNNLPPMIVLQQSELCFDDWRFEFSIIGESHHIRIEQSGVCLFNEVLACVAVAEEQCLHYQSFANLAAHHYSAGQYDVHVSFADEPDWNIPDVGVEQIEHTFPATFGQQPVTCIQWRRSENTVHWWTLHTYAGANGTTYVHTASRFHYDAEGSNL